MCVLSVVAATGAQQAAPASSETGSQFYARYLAAVKGATTIDDVLSFWAERARTQYLNAPSAERVELAELQKGYGSLADIKVVAETGNAMSGTLSLQATFDKQKMIGTVYLVKENGAWKLFGPENWMPAGQ